MGKGILIRAYRRQLLVSVALVIGFFMSAVPLATASPVGGDNVTRKQARLEQMTDRTRAQLHSTPRPKALGGTLSRLAAQGETDKVVVAIKVRPGANDVVATLVTVAGSARSQGGKQRQILSRLGTLSVEVPAAAAEAFMARMRGRGDVSKVELVPRRSLSFIPDDQRYSASALYLDAVTAPAAWDVKQGDPGQMIAVVDSGVDVNHPDLVGRIAETYNAVTPGDPVTDELGHGTFVAGVAVATGNNGIGIAGASMGASVLAVKVANQFGDVWSDDVAAGVMWAADNGAKVINLSLGSETPSQPESDAVAYAVGRGVLVVAAAGNTPSTTPHYPAAYPQVVAVGATDAAGQRATFSSFGSWVTVAAPGVNITSTSPTGGTPDFAPSYDVRSGTSFSSPMVAAEAALLWSLRPSASASDVRRAIVNSAHGYSNLGLGAGQVDFLAAFTALPPDSIPALTQPSNGATVAGVVALAAVSAAPKVGFKIDNVLIGTPVATNAGAAITSWVSWGAANGVHTVSAVDCSIDNLCSTDSTQVGVTLANAAPAVASPTASQTISGTATFQATAPGGGVAFLIDGVRRGFDATAPYAMSYSISTLVDGPHTVRATSCSTTGTSCAGPVSPIVSFIAKSLHPKITAVSPVVFSPNGDGRYDTTKVTYYLPDTEATIFMVRNAAGTIVRGPIGLGTLSAGTRSLTWNGLLNSGARASDGIYRLEFATTRATLRGSAIGYVRVDLTAPTMLAITGSGVTFYPYPDSYKDTFVPTFSLNEGATITLTVRAWGQPPIRTLVGWRAAGQASIAWDGKNAAGLRVPAGTYYWALTAQDPAGNRHTSSLYRIIVSARHLVTKTATLSLRGSQFYLAGGSDSSCTGGFETDSDFAPYGIWLLNTCYSYNDIAGATYRFTLPAAYIYTSLLVYTYGNSYYAPSELGARFTRWATGGYTYTPSEISVDSTNAWRIIGTVAPSGLYSGDRVVETTLFVPNYSAASDYDVSYVRLLVTYKVFV